MKIRFYHDINGGERLQYNDDDYANKDDTDWKDVPIVWEDLNINKKIVLRED